MEIPRELLYTKTHEWVRVEDEVVTVGITDYAQSQLSDLTFVELPNESDTVSADDELAVVESVKAASDVYAPVSGTIESVNESLQEQPDLINTDPFGGGWLFKIKLSEAGQLDDLLTVEQYEEIVPED